MQKLNLKWFKEPDNGDLWALRENEDLKTCPHRAGIAPLRHDDSLWGWTAFSLDNDDNKQVTGSAESLEMAQLAAFEAVRKMDETA